MTLEILTIPCLSDNYAFVIHDDASGETAIVDVPEAAPLSQALDTRGWTLSQVWLTHHHWDHVDGLPELLARHPAKVVGAKADAHRLPPLDLPVSEASPHKFAGQHVQIMDVSGHTLGHIAFHIPSANALFTADSLMALGCGRLFEGTPAQMFDSLSKFDALPDETIVYSGHEYTASNAKFALTVDPGNPELISRANAVAAARAQGKATVPSTLKQERATNPFLRTHDQNIQKRIDMSGAQPVDIFTKIRTLKDQF